MVDEQSLRQYDLGQVLRVSSQLTIVCAVSTPLSLVLSGAKVSHGRAFTKQIAPPRIKEKQAVYSSME